MNCDPNNLSKFSSCIRCLTDAQLAAVRTFLICKWAQNAGGVNVFPPPTLADFFVQDDSLGVWEIDVVKNPMPAGATGMEFWYQINGGAFQFVITNATIANNPIQGPGPQQGAGTVVGVEARYVNGASVISGFSPVFSIIMGP